MALYRCGVAAAMPGPAVARALKADRELLDAAGRVHVLLELYWQLGAYPEVPAMLAALKQAAPRKNQSNPLVTALNSQENAAPA